MWKAKNINIQLSFMNTKNYEYQTYTYQKNMPNNRVVCEKIDHNIKLTEIVTFTFFTMNLSKSFS